MVKVQLMQLYSSSYTDVIIPSSLLHENYSKSVMIARTLGSNSRSHSNNVVKHAEV